MNNYHDWVFWVLVLASIVAVAISVALAILENDGGLGVLAFITFGIIVGTFWIILSQEHSVQDVSRVLPAVVIKTPTSVIITLEDKPVMTITDVATYNKIGNTTNVSLIQDGGINFFGTTNWGKLKLNIP